MRQQRTSDQDRLLHILGRSAFKSYEKLLSYGCDEELGRWLLELAEGSRQLVGQRYSPGKQYLHKRDSYEVTLRGMSLRQARAHLRKIEAGTKKLRSLVEPFDAAFQPRRESTFGHLLDQFQAQKLHLEDRLTKIGPKAHPDLTEAIEIIIATVYRCTHQFHDREVSEVLEAAIGKPRPAGYPSFPSADALKMWRKQRGFAGWD